ncbi:NAD-dependent epimerase/dehydratase family protein [Mycobacterium sp. NPDC003323]
MSTTDHVLVTGGFGLVGTATVEKLVADGRRVTVTDLDTPANREAAASLTGADVRWCDLTDPKALAALLVAVVPTAVIHLAAVIPPFCYSRPALARKVNVGATQSLTTAAAQLAIPPRLVVASSIATYGPRNPHRVNDILTAETAQQPADNYGTHKVEAERIVRDSGLEWVILRLGGVLTTRPRLTMHLDMIYFEGLLPTDGRIQTVDVRDAAHAFVAATTADVVGEVLLIGGDTSHRLTQGDIAGATAAAVGLVRGLPPGRPGDPDSADGWFATDWMDTARAQEALAFQHHSWPAMLSQTRRNAGVRWYALRLAAPLVRVLLKRRSAYYRKPGRFADPWQAIRERWGDPRRES